MGVFMKPLYTFLDQCRLAARYVMHIVARVLNAVTKGRINPNGVTLFAVAAHVPVAWLIAVGELRWAALGLIVFGLLDTLDGELARLQGRASNMGMLLDATTDRIKEVILYSGAAYYFTQLGNPRLAIWAVAACGFSICVSFVKAKGEVAVSDHKLTPNEKNRLFQDGLLRFEVRMTLLAVGLLIGQLAVVTAVIAILAALTVADRIIKISRKLNVQS
jgi:CDP-diacylglycerol---glycerol-3-phosphate 3-phosphatidyltransferase